MTPPEIGVGLWTQQAHLPRPRSHALLHDDLLADARFAEQAGIDSLWVSEHHLWYDGYCPASLVAAAQALAGTERLRVGTSMLLLPLHDPRAVAEQARTLHELSHGRFGLGLAAGFVAAEFAAFGVARAERGRLMERGLDVLAEVWGDGPQPEVWIGGSSPAAADRAARRGLSILLPPTRPVGRVTELVARFRAKGGTGRVGIMRDLWLGTDRRSAGMDIAPWLRYSHSQYVAMEGVPEPGPEFDARLARREEAIILGQPADVAEQLVPVLAAEPDLLMFRVRRADQPREQVHRCLDLLARGLAPLLRGVR